MEADCDPGHSPASPQGRPLHEANQGMTAGLADGTANCDRCAVRDADADEENDEEYGGRSGRGVREEYDENLIEAHGEEYEPRPGFKRGYERLELRFGGRGEFGKRGRESQNPHPSTTLRAGSSRKRREKGGTPGDWNTKDERSGFVGFVFDDLAGMNANIVGEIEIVSEFHGR
jgi:hypothetical protein